MKLVALAMAAACGMSAQSPAAATVEQKRLAYYEAYRVWRQSDPDLERDLVAGPAAQLHQRIANARAQAAAYTSARLGYYRQLLAGYEDILQRLSAPGASFTDAIGEIKKHQSLVSAQVTGLARESGALKAEPGKELQRQAADRQWAALLGVQNNLTGQLRDLEQSAREDAASERLRKALLERYEAASALMRQEIAFTTREAGLWQSYYASLDKAVDERRAPATSR